MELDMTKGKPWKLILKFMVPLIIGNIFQQLYNMVDTIIVGRFVGVNALAAVGATGTIMFLILGTLQGLTTGFTVLTSQRFGADDKEGMKRSVGNSIVLSAIVIVFGTVLSIANMKNLLKLMNTPENIFEDSYTYITIICVGFFAIILYNMSASILRAVGNSKVPLYFLAISAVLNIVLDLIFIINFNMGVAGAAWATVISQGVSGILCVIYIVKKVPLLHITKEHLKLDDMVVKNQLSVGIPMALQFGITAIGTIMVQSVLNLFGAIAVAAFTAANKVVNIATQPFMAIGMTMATYCAQNKGINALDRIKKGVVISNLLCVGYSIVAMVVINFIMPFALTLFVSGDTTDILSFAKAYTLITSIFYIPLAMIFIFRNALQGSGYAFVPMMGGVVELVSRVIIANIAARRMSYVGVCLADAITWLITAVFLWLAYLYIMKQASEKSKKVMSES